MMRGVFDEKQLESVQQSRHTELTLGAGTIVAILGGLVLLCALCFGLGYAIGRGSSGPSSTTRPQPATDQEPLQASGAIPKPSAVTQTPLPPPPTSAEASEQAAAANQFSATPDKTAAAAGAVAQPEVRPAFPATNGQQPTANGNQQVTHPALQQSQAQGQAQGQEFMVQIAAVSNSTDAEVLVNALKKRNYPVTSKRESADNFIHVRIGPFATRQLAEQWRMKLLNDGYNALIQP
jgi:cell division septation protein DedD